MVVQRRGRGSRIADLFRTADEIGTELMNICNEAYVAEDHIHIAQAVTLDVMVLRIANQEHTAARHKAKRLIAMVKALETLHSRRAIPGLDQRVEQLNAGYAAEIAAILAPGPESDDDVVVD